MTHIHPHRSSKLSNACCAITLTAILLTCQYTNFPLLGYHTLLLSLCMTSHVPMLAGVMKLQGLVHTIYKAEDVLCDPVYSPLGLQQPGGDRIGMF